MKLKRDLMAREKIPVIRHIESGEVFSFEDGDYDNAVGVFMKSKGWTHQDVEWLADDYYAVTWAENLDHWNLDVVVAKRADEGWPAPIGIEGFGYLRPQAVHICSMTASQYVDVVEYRALWADDVRNREDFDEISDYWFGELLMVNHDGGYEDYSGSIDKFGRPRREAFTAIAGPYYFTHEHTTEQDRDDEMRELCQSNPPC